MGRITLCDNTIARVSRIARCNAGLLIAPTYRGKPGWVNQGGYIKMVYLTTDSLRFLFLFSVPAVSEFQDSINRSAANKSVSASPTIYTHPSTDRFRRITTSLSEIMNYKPRFVPELGLSLARPRNLDLWPLALIFDKAANKAFTGLFNAIVAYKLLVFYCIMI